MFEASSIRSQFCAVNQRLRSRDGETGYSFVHRQPATPDEIDEAEEALQACPSESIGSDGATADGNPAAPTSSLPGN